MERSAKDVWVGLFVLLGAAAILFLALQSANLLSVSFQSTYRVVGKFIKDAAPREVAVDSLTGDAQTYTTEGVVEFTLDGQTLRMRPMTTRPSTPPEMWLPARP